MNIVVAGAGAIGYQVAKTLAADGQNVVIIDPEAAVIKDAVNRFDCMAITGYANNLDDLASAKIEDADFFLALTGSDELNILSCAMVSAEFHRVKTIARVRNGTYANTRLYKSLGSGIHYFINPEIETAVSILRALAYGASSSINAFQGMDIQIRSLAVTDKTKLAGMQLMELSKLSKLRFLVLLINRGETYLVPKGTTKILQGDILYIAAPVNDFTQLFARFGMPFRAVDTVLICGGGRMAETIAGFVSGAEDAVDLPELDGLVSARLRGKMKIRLLESDIEKAKELAERLPNCDIIQGDLADEALFDEEQLGDCDVILSLGSSEERNIIAGLYGKRMGIERAVCLVSSGNYLSISRHLDIDVSVSLKNAVAASVLGIIREGSIESVQTLGDGSMEILEFIPESDCKLINTEIMNLNFPPETLVLAIKRGTASFIVNGRTMMMAGDRVLVLTRKDKTAKVQELFKVGKA